jgi:hypothetical protein
VHGATSHLEDDVDTMQTWIVIGVPGLMLASGLFIGRDQRRAIVGFVVLIVTMLSLALIAGSTLSAAAVGLLLVVLVANGRGQTDAKHHEHHEQRERFTTTGS